MSEIEKRPVKLIVKFVKFVKNKASENEFPFDNISKSLTIATTLFWKEWDAVKNDQSKREQFIKKIREESKELESKGFLHNSRGTKSISKRPKTDRGEIPHLDLVDITLLDKFSKESLTKMYEKLNKKTNLNKKEYDIIYKIYEILTKDTK